MKKWTSKVLCGIIAFLAVYSTSFADANLAEMKVLADFILSGLICTAFIYMMWNFVKTEN